MRFRVFPFLVLAVVISVWVVPARATRLGDVAAQLQPGQWTVLNSATDGSGYNTDLLISCTGSDCADNILNYANEGHWNPLTRELHYIGQGHGGRLLKHISYAEATNRWSIEAKPYWDCSPSPSCYSLVHNFDQTTIDPRTGDLFARKFNSTEVYRWTRATKTWSKLPAAPNPQVAIALEYFPDVNGLLLLGGGEVHLLRDGASAWERLASNLPMGPYNNVANYNPTHRIVLFGGGNGSQSVYKIDASLRITPVASAPAPIGVMSGLIVWDPASGRHLLFSSTGGFFEYDVAGDQWRALNGTSVPAFASNSNRIIHRALIPVSTYGLVLVLTFDFENSKVYAYRHAASQSGPVDTTPPAPPRGLTVR